MASTRGGKYTHIELSELLGLRVEVVTESCELIFGSDVNVQNHSVRTIDEMTEVLIDPGVRQPHDLYHMYRGVTRPSDSQLWKDHGLRLDFTVLRPGTVGNEYIKTLGHYHPNVVNSPVPYPELYVVVYGEAWYLAQRSESFKSCTVTDVLLMKGNPGRPVVIPPYYGHATVNVGPNPLVMVNVTADGFSSIYEPLKLCRGAAYYVLKGDSGPEAVPNTHYEQISPLRRAECVQIADFGLNISSPIYNRILANIGKLEWLLHPQAYREFFDQTVREL